MNAFGSVHCIWPMCPSASLDRNTFLVQGSGSNGESSGFRQTVIKQIKILREVWLFLWRVGKHGEQLYNFKAAL